MQVGFNKRAPTPQDPAITEVSLNAQMFHPSYLQRLQMRRVNERMTKTAVAGRYIGEDFQTFPSFQR